MDAIVLMPIIAGIGLIFWSDSIKPEYPFMAFMLQLMFIPLIFLSVHLGIIEASITYASNSALVETLSNVAYYIGWLMWGIGIYFAFVIMGKAYDIVRQKKAEKNNRKYGDD
jgi:hypothetical protein